MPHDYSLGKIFKFECKNTGNVFYGNTIEPILARRLSTMKTQFLNYQKSDTKVKFSGAFVILYNDNYEISLVELFPCDTKDELVARERYHINNNSHCVNRIYANKQLQKEFRLLLCQNPAGVKEPHMTFIESMLYKRLVL